MTLDEIQRRASPAAPYCEECRHAGLALMREATRLNDFLPGFALWLAGLTRRCPHPFSRQSGENAAGDASPLLPATRGEGGPQGRMRGGADVGGGSS